MGYMAGGEYNLRAFQSALAASGKLTPATVIVYVSVVRTALRRMRDTSPESVAFYLANGARDRAFPSAWRSFVTYARGRGRLIGDLPQALQSERALVEPWPLYPARVAYATLIQIAMQAYWKLDELIPLRCIDEAGSSMRRNARKTWREMTGGCERGEWSGEQGALHDALLWGWNVHEARFIKVEMEDFTLFPRTPRQNEQITVSEMAGIALGVNNRGLAERIARIYKLHLPPPGVTTPVTSGDTVASAP